MSSLDPRTTFSTLDRDVRATMTGTIEQPPCLGNMYAGLIHSDLLGDVHNPVIGEIGTSPARSCGIMEGGFIGDASISLVIGDMETTVIGDIPIGPARSCGDIYGTGAVGDIHAGLWAGYMITGITGRFGDTETT